jgi:hypothetical protein
MVGILSWLLHTLFSTLLAYLCFITFRSGRKSLDLALFIFYWVFFTTLSLLLIGLVGLLTPLAIGGLSLLGSAILMLVPRTRLTLAGIPSTAKEYSRDWLVWVSGMGTWIKALSVIFLLYMVIRIVFLIWALPPFVWDSLAYHLTNVAQWIQDARIHMFDTPVERIYNAANHEVFTTWFAIFLHHDVIIEAAGLSAYLIAGLAVYAIARNLELNPNSAWLAVLAYLSTPALTLAITGTKNDPVMAALFLLAIALVLHESDPQVGNSFSAEWKIVPLLVSVILYAAGTKAYIAHLLPGIAFIGAGMLIRRRGWRSIREYLEAVTRALRDVTPGIQYSIAFILAASLFLGLYWYGRNWILMGNPFFPYSVQVGQRELLSSDIGGFRFGLQNFMETMRLFLERFGDKLYRIRPDLPYTTGWGWVAYAMGIPAAIWCIIRERSYRVLAAGFLISFLVLLFSSPTSPWSMRYFVWFPACLAIAIGYVFERFTGSVHGEARILKMLFSALTALNLIMVVTYNSIRIVDIEAMLRLPVGERGSAMFSAAVPEAYQEFIKYVPRDELLGYNVTGNGFVYPLYRADFSQRIVYIPIPVDSSCEEIVQTMIERGTRYLQTAPVQTADGVRSKLFDCSQAGGTLQERGADLYVIGK